ncbi:hypothetical protein DFH09DRAFT_1153060 [Mycena vulgaris]|nr:hypothetical protein DFH09DRAFT_1153060 [Mycena vulgaris]
MPLLQRRFRELISYRLGYSPQRPYPWRWTTPVVLSIFLLLSAFLAALNVPLSAYIIIQESTYRPNDTIPPLPLSYMIPAILQNPTDGFAPQILRVGDTVQLNNSVFKFTVAEAFNVFDKTQPVSSFSYYNNPFSDGCDITNMTANYAIAGSSLDLTVAVNCHIPTLFTLTWNGNWEETSIPFPWGTSPAQQDLNSLAFDLVRLSTFGVLRMNNVDSPVHSGVSFEISGDPLTNGDNMTSFRVTVQPCCDCGEDPEADSSLPSQPSCSSRPARFRAAEIYIGLAKEPDKVLQPNTTNIFAQIPPFIHSYSGDNSSFSGLNAMFQNTFQSLYHSVRMELGIIFENQIYAFPDMYNRSMSNFVPPIPGAFDGLVSPSPVTTVDAPLVAEWKDAVRSFNDSDRVPVMFYLRPVPRLKPLGSAITSVFVSTFAMLSTLWTIFSLIAGVFAKSHVDTRDAPRNETTLESTPRTGWDAENMAVMHMRDGSNITLYSPNEEKSPPDLSLERLNLALENHSIRTSIAMAEMQLSLARMKHSLKKHGMLEDGVGASQNKAAHDLRDGEETDALLTHRVPRGSGLDSGV